jgi:hypothetical protein
MEGGTVPTPVFDPNKLITDPISNTDQNTQNQAERDIDDGIQDLIGGPSTPTRTFTDNVNSLAARTTLLESYTVLTAKGDYTRTHGGFHGDIIYKDADEIVIKTKEANGLGAWIGAYLNDGTYLELASDYTIKYDTPGNSGHIADGITAKLNNEWFVIWAYEDAGGALAFCITWMPNTTFSNANPTNALTLNTINAQNIGYLFNPASHVVCYQDIDEWESPLAWQNAGAITRDATKDKPKISSRTTTVLTLGANLENNNFTATSQVYQVDNFKPLAVDDGLIVDIIGARGYLDTGFRFRTNGSANIYEFFIDDDEVYYADGSGAASYSGSQGIDYVDISGVSVTIRSLYSPPDCAAIIWLRANNGLIYTGSHDFTYAECTYELAALGGILLKRNARIQCQLWKFAVGGTMAYATRGYFLK